MDRELLKELGLVEVEALDAVEYAQKCVFLYEQTLKAMGLYWPNFISQAVDSSQVTYLNPADPAEGYAYLPERY